MATLLSALETQVRRHLLEPAALATPSAPTVAPQGTTGATTYTYKIVALNATGSTDASSATSTTTGNATLDGTNFNRLTWTAVTGATGYWVYRTASGGTPSTTGRIATLGVILTYDDQGAAGDSTTAPTTNTTGLDQPFWSSDELIAHCSNGIHDLWRAVVDLHQGHFNTIDTTNVGYTAEATTLSGIPSDVYRVSLIEPTDTTSGGTAENLQFVPRKYNSREFINARQEDSFSPSNGGVVYYDLLTAGAPIAAPTVAIAPPMSSTLAAGTIRLVYVPTLAALTSASTNPIPGESDQAVIAWCVAYARAKEREDRSPDPNWLAVYATEKQNILTSLTPRQTQEPDVVDALFAQEWQ